MQKSKFQLRLEASLKKYQEKKVPEVRYGPREKIIYIPESNTYEFGYYSKVTGMCVIFKEGESGMQSGFAVKLINIRKTFK